jgi:hypothetical protein
VSGCQRQGACEWKWDGGMWWNDGMTQCGLSCADDASRCLSDSLDPAVLYGTYIR